jgi:hypothetical protein
LAFDGERSTLFMFISSSEPNSLGAADKLSRLGSPPTHILALLYFATNLTKGLDYHPVSNPWIVARRTN